MRRRQVRCRGRSLAIVASGTLAAAVAGCGGGGPGASPPTPAATSTEALETLYRSRTDSALARFTPADADFMSRMIVHHDQALTMAALVSGRSTSPAMRTLAARITAAQEAEIGLMRQWLEERGQSVEHAPGMMTPEQMNSLAAAEGSSFDRLFLSLMVQHHRGAVAMVEELFATPGAAADPSTFRIASGIQVDQRSEIGRMESMLAALDGAAPPA
jgi:uncharacterized protein (DUF305 family)